MRSLLVIAIALLLSPSVKISPPQQASQPTIEGVVRRGDTGQPLAGAQVTLSLMDLGGSSIFGPLLGPVPGVQPVTTDRDGKFAFRNLSPGTYRISATATGYASRSYGQENPNELAKPVFVSAVQPLRDATIQLMPVGTISGRVLDESGNPATGAPVQVYRTMVGDLSRLQPVGSGLVDDRGIYRVSSILPGRYYLSVGNEVSPSPPRTLAGAASQPAPSYEFQFFPGVRSIDQAVPVDLEPGNELNVDMKTHLQKTYRVRGTVLDGGTGRPAPGSTMQLERQSVSGSTSRFPVGGNVDSSGKFEVHGIPSGSFVLQAQTRVLDEVARAAGEAAWSMFPTARVAIQVKDADLDDVVMILTRPAAVPGQVRFERTTSIPLSSATLHLTPLASEWLPPTAFVRADGAFRVDGVLEGKYSVLFQKVPQGFYVKSIEYAGTDILTKPWQFSGSASGTIEVVLASGVAQLSGTIRDPQSQPVPGGSVALIPDQRSRTDLYRLAVADQNGRYVFASVAPGAYKVFSWQSIEFGAYLNPNFIQRFEQDGRIIRLADASMENLDVRVIAPR